MDYAFHMLCSRYSGPLTPTAPLTTSLLENFSFILTTYGWLGRAMMLCNVHCLCVQLIWITVGQGSTVFAVDTGGGGVWIFLFRLSFLFSFSFFFWETHD